jgi:hypothetical protein
MALVNKRYACLCYDTSGTTKCWLSALMNFDHGFLLCLQSWQVVANNLSKWYPINNRRNCRDYYFLSCQIAKGISFTQKSISLGFNSTVHGCMEKWVVRKKSAKPSNQCFQMWVQLQVVLGQVWIQLISPQNLRTKFYKIWMSVHTSENCHFKQEKQIQQPCCTLAIFTSWSELSWP